MSVGERSEETEIDNRQRNQSHTFNALSRGIHEIRKHRNSKSGYREPLFTEPSIQGRSPGNALSVISQKRSCCSDCEELWFMVTEKWLNLLLLAGIPAVLVVMTKQDDVTIFICNFLVMIPLASMLGDLTEVVASWLGESIGGIINATFGNAVELILTIIALRAGEIRVVKVSLLGSVFSNTLLVLGHAMTVAGRKDKRNDMKFNYLGASFPVIMLLLTGILITMTTFQKYWKSDDEQDPEVLIWSSRIGAIILIVIYSAYLIFSLRTHKFYFVDEDQQPSEEQLSLWGSIIALAIVTAIVSFCCISLVNAIDGMCAKTHITETFLGVVLLPFIANCIEHWTAVICAYRGKMNLAIAISLGSASQIMMFVLPTGVLFGWTLEVDVNTAYPLSDVALYLLTVVIVALLVQQGKANWMYGILLISIYGLLAVAFWYEEVDDDN